MGDIEDRKDTFGSLSFHCFLLPFVWLELGLGVPSALRGLFGSGKGRGARVGPSKREPETAQA